jgi:DNA-binding transcriptional LysR family regulator
MFDPDYDLFVQIIEAGSISAVARQRGASVAGLSKRLSQLEERLGVRLIHRTTRSLRLTVAGREFFKSLLPLRAALSAAEGRISGANNQLCGIVRVTAPTSFGRIHVIPCIPDFLARFPQIELQIDLSDDFVDLRDASYDIAIRIDAKIDPGLVSRRLGTSRRVLCAAPAYLEQFGNPKSLDELKHHRLLATDRQLPWQLDGPDGHLSYHGASYVRTNSSEVVRELALAGCGIALRSLWDVSGDLKSSALKQVLPQYQGSQEVGIFAVHLPTPSVPARLQVFVDHLEDFFSASALLHFD